MGQPYGRGYLGDLGQRLQRLLGFDGEAGATFDSKAIPVLICGDATLPGYGGQQSRRFVVPSGVVAAGSFFYFQADADVIIRQFRVTMQAAGVGNLEWRMMALGTAPGAAIATAGFYLDRSLSNNDRPPLSTYVNPAATAGAVIQNLTCAAGAPNVGEYVTLCDQPFLLAAGQAMGVLNNSAGLNPRFEIWGQTL